jgi:hypothetical protein
VPAIALPSDHRVTAVPFADPGIQRTVALAQRNDRALARPAQALADQLTAAAASTRPPADPPRSSAV